MRIAITGANSSVGHAFLTHLVNQTDNELTVNAGVRTQHAADSLPNHSSIAPYIIRYGDSDSLDKLFDGATCVVHLAGILIESPSSNYQTANVDATSAVIEAARRANLAHVLGAGEASRLYRNVKDRQELVYAIGSGAYTPVDPGLLLIDAVLEPEQIEPCLLYTSPSPRD